jgi:hypothetical protein
MKLASKPSEIPQTAHYAIIIFETRSMLIPGDERSKQAPGHGYPEHTETFLSHKYFYGSQKAAEDFIKLLLIEKPKRDDYVVLEVNGVLKIDMKIQLEK